MLWLKSFHSFFVSRFAYRNTRSHIRVGVFNEMPVLPMAIVILAVVKPF